MTNEVQQIQTPKVKSYKYSKLVIGIFFDLIGMISYIIPGYLEFIDVAWAPLSGFILSKMYKGNVGKVAGTIEFLEELIPFTDAIPTFTLTWIYVYVFKKEQ